MALPGVYDAFQHWCNQTVWIYSDTHFGDKDLSKGVPNRPSDEEHVRFINSKVGKKDTLILLGDVGDVEWARKLKGYKILICGNHDAGKTIYKEVFDEVYEGALIIGEKLILSHEPVDIPWALNIHGHIHDLSYQNNKRHFNVCSDYIGYEPVNLNKFLKKGPTAKILSLHRQTINTAVKKKVKRNKRKEVVK